MGIDCGESQDVELKLAEAKLVVVGWMCSGFRSVQGDGHIAARKLAVTKFKSKEQLVSIHRLEHLETPLTIYRRSGAGHWGAYAEKWRGIISVNV